MESSHISVWINRSAADVYAFAADVANLPLWAAGLAQPGAEITVEFVPANDFGVLDHMVRMSGAEPTLNPMRVMPDGADRCELVFTLRRRPGMSEAEYQADARAVAADLGTLKRLMEASH